VDNFPKHCKHYRPEPGMVLTCDKGIDIRSFVGGEDFGWMARMPCAGGAFATEQNPTIPCDKMELPTDAEVEAARKETNRAIHLMEAGICPQCEAKLEHATGGVSRCPSCPDVWIYACGNIK